MNRDGKARQEALMAQAMGRPMPTAPAWPDTKSHGSPGVPPLPNTGPPLPGGIQRRRPYMAGLGRFLTEARLAERLGGEHPYAYAMNNPTTDIDPNVLQASYPGPAHGIPIKQIHYPGPSHGIPIPELINCGSKYAEIRKHLKDVCESRIPQLPPGPMRTCLEKRCQNAVIECLPANDPRCSGAAGITPCPPGQFRRGFYLCPDAWDKPRYGCLGKTILHEMCHTCGNLGAPIGGDTEAYCEGLAVNTYGPGKPPCPE